MSISALIDISLQIENGAAIKATEIVKSILANGWTIENKGRACYLPLDDNEMYEWIEERIGRNDLLRIVEQKEKAKEVIGITFYWQNTNTGLQMLAFSSTEFSFNLNINRIKIKTGNMDQLTDASWCFERIVPCFDLEYIKIGRLSFSQE